MERMMEVSENNSIVNDVGYHYGYGGDDEDVEYIDCGSVCGVVDASCDVNDAVVNSAAGVTSDVVVGGSSVVGVIVMVVMIYGDNSAWCWHWQ
ncbi:Hypothetical predicted protein [Octopus vulgaris]|uniref:Uncharacterized protein n=1 Tax=Octopus vulgaris TaxID=6645 RepID=A0AA36AHV0_OCTVU|nr:Hypothetical predicted protein [Octopus vulgaris]